MSPVLPQAAGAGASSRLSRVSRRSLAAAAGVVVAAALILLGMGRVPICECGYVKLWHGVVFSAENSQHLTDWYTFSHVIHGFAFYLVLWLLGRPFGWAPGLRFVLAVTVEAGWEVLENTPAVIERYREVTIALDYYGDSVINSVADIGSMALGYALAMRLPIVLVVTLAVLMELAVAYWIRDNLTLNIIQLIYPLEFILEWQRGG